MKTWAQICKHKHFYIGCLKTVAIQKINGKKNYKLFIFIFLIIRAGRLQIGQGASQYGQGAAPSEICLAGILNWECIEMSGRWRKSELKERASVNLKMIPDSSIFFSLKRQIRCNRIPRQSWFLLAVRCIGYPYCAQKAYVRAQSAQSVCSSW